MEDFRKRYEALYHDMATSKDVNKMLLFGNAEQWVFNELAAQNPRLAEKWVEKLEAMAWNNCLTKFEAEEVVSKLVNQNGSRGGKWSYIQFETAVKSLNGMMDDKPYYNKYALWATANMLYSDHAKSLSEFIQEKDMPKAIYLLSIEKLKDVDHPRFAREYFGL